MSNHGEMDSATQIACTFALPAKYGKLRPRKRNVKLSDGVYSFESKEFTCDILD